MTSKLALLLCLASALLSAALTRTYFSSVKIQIVETTKEVVSTDVQTVVHTVTLPGGAVDTTTTTIDHTQRVETAAKQVTQVKTPVINVSALVSVNFNGNLLSPVYGVSVSKEMIGPITVGAFGLTSGVVGASLGLNF